MGHDKAFGRANEIHRRGGREAGGKRKKARVRSTVFRVRTPRALQNSFGTLNNITATPLFQRTGDMTRARDGRAGRRGLEKKV